MTGSQDGYIVKRLRLAGLLILAGLAVEAISLGWNHPLSFIAFLGLGGLLLAAGILVYLLALVTPTRDRRDRTSAP
jgi:hypothetical protein